MWLLIVGTIALIALAVLASLVHWASADDPARRAAADAVGLRPQDMEWCPTKRRYVPKPGARPEALVSSGPEPAPGSALAVAMAAWDAERDLDKAARMLEPSPGLGRLRLELEAFKRHRGVEMPTK